jgi:hypothetical protein
VSALPEFRERVRHLAVTGPEQPTRWSSLILWGYKYGLTRAEMVAVLSEEVNFAD